MKIPQNPWTLSAAGLGCGLVFLLPAVIMGWGDTAVPAKALFFLEPLFLAAVFFLSGRRMNRLKNSLERLETERDRISAELSAENQRTRDSQRSLRTIIDNLDTGICTVNREFLIDENFNSEFSRLFGRSDFAGKSILAAVFTTWTEKQKAELAEAVELAFMNTASSDEMLNNILPARELVALGTVPGDARYVDVRISRVFSGGSAEKVMFIFKDITLARKLQDEEQRHQRILDDQYGRISRLLRHERTVVFGFFSSFTAGMDRIAEALKRLSQGASNSGPVRDVIALVHSIKGEAFSLDLEACAEKAKEFESYLRSIENTDFGLEQHLQVIGLFEALADERRIFERMLGKMAEFTGRTATPDNDGRTGTLLALSDLAKSLEPACSRSAGEESKAVSLVLDAEAIRVPEEVFLAVKEALIHLVRNSIAHGIEPPEERRAKGKPEKGTITIRAREADGLLSVEFTDDGSGFDYGKIRETIVRKGLRSAEEAERLSPRELIPFVFKDGFSTRSRTDMVAGLGAGLYAVRKIVTGRLKGTIAVSNPAGGGVGFRMGIPAAAREAVSR